MNPEKNLEFPCESEEIHALQQQLIRIKEIVFQKKQKSQELENKNRAQERVINYLRKRFEESSLQIYHLQLELESLLKTKPTNAEIELQKALQRMHESVREKEQAQHERVKMQELLFQKEKIFEETKSRLQISQVEKNQYLEKLRFAQSAAKESEEQLRQAQKHLAKKLKETAQANEEKQKLELEGLEIKKEIEKFQTQLKRQAQDLQNKTDQVKKLENEKTELSLMNRQFQTQLQDTKKKLLEFQKLESLTKTVNETEELKIEDEEPDLLSQKKPPPYYKKSLFE